MHSDPVAGPALEIRGDSGPLVAVAVHAGHVVRPEVAEVMAVHPHQRRYEEDPYSDRWAEAMADVAIIMHRSRFEVDVDRPRHRAVSQEPGDAWGLDVWRTRPPDDVMHRTLAIYDAFYVALETVLTDTVVRHGGFVLFDLHAYNYRRGGPHLDGDTDVLPDVDVATVGVRSPWVRAAGRFTQALADQEVEGRRLDVRMNVRPMDGRVAEWVNARFGRHGFAVSVGVKKIHVDEHTGELLPEAEAGLEEALANAARDVVPLAAPSDQR